MVAKTFNKERQKELIYLYDQKKSIRYLANLFNCNAVTIWRELKRIRKHENRRTIYKDIDHNFFDIIDNEEKAYFLGFMYADGYISNTHSFELAVHKFDIEILEKFSRSLNYNGPIRHSKRDNCVKIGIHSKKLTSDLIKHGCINSKTYKIRIPNISNELINHFIRGYFDGDGSLGLYGKNKTKLTSCITSNIQFCIDIKQIIESFVKDIPIYITSRKNSIGISDVKINGRYAMKFFDWLYDDSSIYLTRKYDIYKKALNVVKR